MPRAGHDLLQRIRRLARTAALADVDDAIPSAPASVVGGAFWALPGEAWPYHEGEPMTALVQLRVDELPLRLAALEDIALLSVFVGRQMPPIAEAGAGPGTAVEVREYPRLDGLVPLAEPERDALRTRRLRWRLVDDHPDRGALPRLLPGVDAAELDAARDAASAPHHSGTKVGGWPSRPPAGVSDASDDLVLQVDEAAAGMRPDGALCWLFRDAGVWVLRWDV